MAHIYLLTRLYNTMDKRRTCELERTLLHCSPNHTTYMPYRDSDEDHIIGDWKKGIFNRDIEEIERSEILVGYWDGPSFDEGIGFEIGFGLAKGKRVIIINDDFLQYAIDGSVNAMRFPDPLIQALRIPVLGSIFSMSSISTYEDDLRSTASRTHQEVAEYVNANGFKIDLIYSLEKQKPSHDGYVDSGSSQIIKSVLNKWAVKNNYRVAQRFNNPGDPALALKDIYSALSSRMLFVVNSGAEMTPGSSILCGLCYGFEIPYAVIQDRTMIPYSMAHVGMCTNIMIDVPCARYISSQEIET